MHAKAGNVQQNCKSTYQACLTPIEPLAEERYRKAVERYDDELDRYRRRTQVRIPGLGTHHTRLGLGWLSRGLGFAVGLGGGPYYGLGYSSPFFYQQPPLRPNRMREFDRLRYQQCEVECGCQSVQDACFLGCGGRKIIEERCIANCPKRKKPACVEQNKGWQSRRIAGRAGDSIA